MKIFALILLSALITSCTTLDVETATYQPDGKTTDTLTAVKEFGPFLGNRAIMLASRKTALTYNADKSVTDAMLTTIAGAAIGALAGQPVAGAVAGGGASVVSNLLVNKAQTTTGTLQAVPQVITQLNKGK